MSDFKEITIIHNQENTRNNIQFKTIDNVIGTIKVFQTTMYELEVI